MSDQSTLLLEHHLKELKLPTFLREYGKLAAQCAAEGVSHPDYLLRLAEVELTDRHQRMVQRRIRAARFPATKGLDTFDFSAIPSVNQPLVTQLARCEYVEHHENVIAIGNSGTGKTHVALGHVPKPPRRVHGRPPGCGGCGGKLLPSTRPPDPTLSAPLAGCSKLGLSSVLLASMSHSPCGECDIFAGQLVGTFSLDVDRCTGALSYPFSTPRHSSFRWIGGYVRVRQTSPMNFVTPSEGSIRTSWPALRNGYWANYRGYQ